MTENVENLVLEFLRALRNEVKANGQRMDEQFQIVFHRLASMEGQMVGIHSDIAGLQLRLDRLDARLIRIEHRLDLIDEV